MCWHPAIGFRPSCACSGLDKKTPAVARGPLPRVAACLPPAQLLPTSFLSRARVPSVSTINITSKECWQEEVHERAIRAKFLGVLLLLRDRYQEYVTYTSAYCYSWGPASNDVDLSMYLCALSVRRMHVQSVSCSNAVTLKLKLSKIAARCLPLTWMSELRGVTLVRLQSESGDHQRKRVVEEEDYDGALKQDCGKRKKRGNLPKDAVEHLYTWLKEHWYLLARAVVHASARRSTWSGDCCTCAST